MVAVWVCGLVYSWASMVMFSLVICSFVRRVFVNFLMVLACPFRIMTSRQ